MRQITIGSVRLFAAWAATESGLQVRLTADEVEALGLCEGMRLEVDVGCGVYRYWVEAVVGGGDLLRWLVLVSVDARRGGAVGSVSVA